MNTNTSSISAAKRKPDWRLQGACRSHNDPNIWHATGNTAQSRAEVNEAIAICGACPVSAICRDWALTNREVYGTWGGMTEAERRRILRIRVNDGEIEPRRGGRPRAACGTSSAYDRHVKYGEPIDDACRAAHRKVSAERRARASQQRTGATKQLAA